VAIVIIILLLGLIVIEVPIGISMGLSAVLYFLLSGLPMEVIIQKAVGGVNSFELTAIPMFMLAGELMSSGGVSRRLVKFTTSLVGHFKGGFGNATVLTCMIFGGATGSTMAEIAAVGPLTIPGMVKQGYKREFAAAIVGVASELGPIIPPSIQFIIVASLAQLSVGKLLLSGLIPGILIGLLLMVVVYIISRIKGYPTERMPRASLKTVIKDTKESFFAILMPVVLIGGMVSGIFTPTESAGIGVLYALIVSTLIYKELSLKDIYQACVKTVVSAGTIMFIIAMANLYAYMLTREQIGQSVAQAIGSIGASPSITLLLVVVCMIPVGMVLSSTPALMLLVPILVPFSKTLNMDPIMFFAVVTMSSLIGSLTPPVALSLYLTSQIAETKPEKTFIQMIPLISVIYVVLVACSFIPSMTTWIPNMVYK